MEYILNIKYEKYSLDPEIITEIIEIYPKYIFFNKTTTEMAFMQSGFPGSNKICKPNSKCQFEWGRVEKDPSFKLIFPGALPSSEFSFVNNNPIAMQLMAPSGRFIPGLIRVEKYKKKNVLYIKASNENDSPPLYLLKNESRWVTVGYKEGVSNTAYNYIDILSQSRIGWAYDNGNNDFHYLTIIFLWGSIRSKPLVINSNTYNFSMEKIGKPKQITLWLTPKYGKIINVEAKTEGQTKILCITDIDKIEYSSLINSREKSWRFEINQLGISAISTILHKKTELFYLTIKGVEFVLEEKGYSQYIAININKMQLDNQMEYITKFPVTFCPSIDTMDMQMISIKFYTKVKEKENNEMYKFDKIDIKIDPLVLKVDEKQMDEIGNFLLLCKFWDDKVEKKEEIQGSPSLCINSFRLNPLNVIASCQFLGTYKHGENRLLRFMKYAFFNAHNVEVKLDEVVLMNFCESPVLLAQLVLNELQKQLENEKAGLITQFLINKTGFNEYFSSPEEITPQKCSSVICTPSSNSILHSSSLSVHHRFNIEEFTKKPQSMNALPTSPKKRMNHARERPPRPFYTTHEIVLIYRLLID